MFLEILQNNCNFIEKETLAQVFSCEFCEICKDTFSTESAAECLQTTAFAPSSSLSLPLLLISPMSVFCSNSKDSKKIESGISFSLSYFHWVFFVHVFSAFLSFVSFFLVLLIKRILVSWELIKMFLPPLTSLKYVHVSKPSYETELCKMTSHFELLTRSQKIKSYTSSY